MNKPTVEHLTIDELRDEILAAQPGLSTHDAHILAVRAKLGIAEPDETNTQRPGIPNRLVGLALAGLLLLTGIGPAFAGGRDNFPDNRCPGSGCPDNAQPGYAPDDGRGSGR